jgi:DNA (cytosine-5)-methyltransferase 1
MKMLSLFSGVGGLDLGLERAGMTVVGQVEINEFCRRVLAKHWPHVERHDDVRTAVDWWQSADRPRVDVVAGGPPCQPFSRAGQQRGVDDSRWMWPAMERVVRALRPRFVIVENVVGLVRDTMAFGWILGDLAALGFDAEWSVLSACSVGAPHTRERLFLVAYSDVLDGALRVGFGDRGQVQPDDGRAGAWRDRVDEAVAASGADGRDADGLAARMVAAGGSAVVPQVAEHVGRLVMSAGRVS